jgi:hypothetical protein
MEVTVYMQAFRPGHIRTVSLPEPITPQTPRHQLLEEVFYWGQNDFQPDPDLPSVSVGDVVELDGHGYRCGALGWKEVPLPRKESGFTCSYCDGHGILWSRGYPGMAGQDDHAVCPKCQGKGRVRSIPLPLVSDDYLCLNDLPW